MMKRLRISYTEYQAQPHEEMVLFEAIAAGETDAQATIAKERANQGGVPAN